MVKVNTSYTDFSAGEISPKMYGRFDLANFYSGHKRVENFIVENTGQASFRAGTVFAAETKGNQIAMLYPWNFDNDISFVLEFTDQVIRFYNNDGIIESGGSPYEVVSPYDEADLFNLKFQQEGLDLYIAHPDYAPRKLTYTSATSWSLSAHGAYRDVFQNSQLISNITQANPPTLTYGGANSFTAGDTVYISGIAGMTELNDKRFLIGTVNTGAKTITLQDLDGNNIDASGYTPWSSGGIIERITQENAPFLSSGKYPTCVGSYEDRIVYGGSNDLPSVLYFSKSGDTDDFTLGDEVDDGIEYFIKGQANNIKWVAGTSLFLAIGTFGDVLQATGGIDDVITPSSISIRPSNSYGVLDIMPVSRNTQIFYSQNNGLKLRSFEYSLETNNYIPIDRNIIADHITNSGIKQLAYKSGSPNVVWAVKNNGELIGMTLEESEGVSGWHRHITDGEIISVASLPRENEDDQLWLCVKRTVNGSTKYYVEFLSDAVTYPDRKDYRNSGNEAQDRINFSNVMFEAQKDYIYLDSCLTYNGTSAGVAASASVTPAASTGTSITFTASASVFNSNDVGREIWRKSITGVETGRAVITGYTSATVVTCDILEDFDSTSAIPSGQWYLTAGTVTGLSHLEGLDVSVLADGGQHSQKTVSSGSITLDRQSSVVHVGLAYSGYIETNSLEGGGTNGTAQTKRKSVHAIGFKFLNSLFARCGVNYYQLQQINDRTAAMNMDRPPLPTTGARKINIYKKPLDNFDAGWQRDVTAIVAQTQPFPCNVQLITPYMDVSNV